MSKLQVSAVLTIKDGQLETFKKLAHQCVSIVREKDTETLEYDWFLNSDETVCVVHEAYTSSEALMQHMGNLGDVLGALLATCDLSIDVFGSPSAELKSAVEGMDINYYSYLAGL